MTAVYQPLRLHQVLPSAIAVVVLGWGLTFLIDVNWTPLGRFGWASLLYGVIAGILFYVGVFFFSCQGWFYTKAMRKLMHSLHGLFSQFSWPAIIVVSILAGVGEELLFRGVLQTWLISVVDPFWGIVLASMVFGLLHYLTKIYVVVTFAIGLLFGALFYYSNSLLLVMLAHTVYDICAFAVIVKYPHLLGIE